MKKTTTPVVDAIGQITFQGNIIPPSWFKTIKRGSKAHLLAINILSDVIYWYRPTFTRDEETGELISVTKKFRSDKLQKQYDAWALQFGQSKEQVKDACDLLVEMGLITREFRNVRTESRILPNVMFVEPIPENIAHITHKIGDISPQKPPPYSGVNTPPISPKTNQTNTENSTESQTKNSSKTTAAASETNSSTSAPAAVEKDRVKILLDYIGVDIQNSKTNFDIALEWTYWVRFFCGETIERPAAFVANRLRANPNGHCPDRSAVERKMLEKPNQFDHLWESGTPGTMTLEF